MSFDCNNCGKNPVDNYGSWCSECQEIEHNLSIESEAAWFSKIQLCCFCSNCEGPDPSDYCVAYNMPLFMVGRKKKCKRFREIIYYK